MILKIAIPIPLGHSFDYLPPATCDYAKLIPGCRIKVPFGARTVIGVLINTAKKASIPESRLKPALELLDQEPVLPQTLMQLNQWASDYYHHPIGEAMLNSLPKLLRDGKAATVRTQLVAPQTLPSPAIKLNSHQQKAVDIINSNTTFKVFLLDGVTGSGKTEVYLQVIAETIAAGKQALVLVPEIGLTPQTVTRFQERFNVPIALFHSQLTDRERLDAWIAAKDGTASIVIGTRSVIFTPLAKPGIIVLDEEHDLSFQQQSGLRYSARDIAVMRGKLEDIPVVLGSATPSLESLYNAERKRYQRLVLPERAGTAIHPSFHVVDLRNQKLQDGLSATLIQEIKLHLSQNNQILLFLNRRGYAPTLLCHSCGFVVECNRCDARMTLHQKPHFLHCHHCGATKPVPKICPECNSDQLLPLGLGTERIEAAIKEIIPEAKVLRIDRDSTRKKQAFAQMLTDIHAQNYQILIGTQMLAKGHHFPNVTMVAIMGIDNSLLSSDFRAEENVAQLIMQVAGRAGRAEKPGKVFIQTYNPHHPLLLQLINYDYKGFTQKSLAERKAANLPPFNFFALLRAESKVQATTMEFLEDLAQQMQKILPAEVKLLGPIPAPLERKAGLYRAQLLINSKKRPLLHKILDHLIEQIRKTKLAAKVNWSLDVDPADML